MIYLFNDVKELTGTVRNNHILNLLYEREKNGIYSVSAEIPVTYNDQGTIYNYNKKIQKSDFLGHYDKEGRFQLHKIAAVDIENGSIFVKGIHIFFDEAKAGAIIKDRRFINREIIDGARVAFESIGWSVADFDVSVGKTYNFYNVTPLEARQILVETFGFEFDYWLDFDGKKVTNRHVAVKEKIGEKTNKRYTYGHNVLNIRAEQDYSEIYTAVIGRGKGEEIEETGGYGRRIEYTDVVWTTPSKPLNKPAGTRILEDTNATQLFGYKENGVVKPRIKVEVFSDIESPTELIQASYDWLMDNNVPKAVFSLKVADGDGLNLGDEVYVIYRDIDLVKSARVEKVIDDLVSGNRDVEFGDTAYFDTDRRLSGLRADLKRYSGETGDRIYRLKMEFNRRFDEEVSSWVEEYEQALIDAHAEVEAAEVRMTEKIETERTQMETAFNESVAQSEQRAKDSAEEKANAVQTNLDSFKQTHADLYDSVTADIINIDEFLGDKSVTLNAQFAEMELGLNQSIIAESGRIDAIVTNFGDSGKSLSQFVIDVDGIETTVASHNDWLGTYGSAAEQTIEGFSQKVWLSDVADIGANLLPFTDFTIPGNTNYWNRYNSDADAVSDDGYYVVRHTSANGSIYLESPAIEVQEGQELTFSFLGRKSNLLGETFDRIYNIYDNGSASSYGTAYLQADGRYRYMFTARRTGKLKIRIGHSTVAGNDVLFEIKEPKIEKGFGHTPYLNSISHIEHLANKIQLSVSDSNGLATTLALSSSAMDIITDNMNLTGNLNVKGQIEAISMSAITADFADLFAARVHAGDVTVEHIEGFTSQFEYLYTLNANIEKLVAQNVFINNINALTIDAVHADLKRVTSQIMETNIIKANWIQGGTALIDKIFASTGMFERMMAKSGFVTTLNTVTIDTDLLTVRRKDGVAWIQDGMARGHVPAQIYDSYASDAVSFTGLNFVTGSSHWQTFKYFYTPHEGSRLRISWAVGLQDGPSNVEYIEVRARNFSDYSPINLGTGVSVRRETITKGNTTYITQDIPMPPPNYNIHAAYLEFRRAPDGQSVNNKVYARILHIGQYE